MLRPHWPQIHSNTQTFFHDSLERSMWAKLPHCITTSLPRKPPPRSFAQTGIEKSWSTHLSLSLPKSAQGPPQGDEQRAIILDSVFGLGFCFSFAAIPDHSHMGCCGSNLGWHHARQSTLPPVPFFYFFDTLWVLQFISMNFGPF